MTCVRLLKENLFCPNNASETYIFISLRHQKLLLVADQLQDSTFFYLRITASTLASVN